MYGIKCYYSLRLDYRRNYPVIKSNFTEQKRIHNYICEFPKEKKNKKELTFGHYDCHCHRWYYQPLLSSDTTTPSLFEATINWNFKMVWWVNYLQKRNERILLTYFYIIMKSSELHSKCVTKLYCGRLCHKWHVTVVIVSVDFWDKKKKKDRPILTTKIFFFMIKNSFFFFCFFFGYLVVTCSNFYLTF